MVEAVSNKTSVIGGTATAGAIGGAALAGTEYLLQRSYLKNPAKLDTLVKSLTDLKNTEATGTFMDKIVKFFIKRGEKGLDDVKKIVESGKINWKFVGKAGLYGAAILGGAYLLYRGVKAIFSKNN